MRPGSKPGVRPGWRPARLGLDPLALLRERFASRSELARATGLGYELLRRYTDGSWTRRRPPADHVMTMLGTAVSPDELAEAVARSLRTSPSGPLTPGQRVVLEALRGFDDATLTAAAPHLHDLLLERERTSQTLPADAPGPSV